MATPSEKLAESLAVSYDIQKRGVVGIQASELSRVHRERLVKNGFLLEVMKGWYIASRPDDRPGDSTPWYSSYWNFCIDYLNHRFGEDWCLSPEQSLLIHANNWTIPKQIVVSAPRGNNKITNFPYGTSLLDVRYAFPDSKNLENKEGLRVYKLNAALISVSSKFFTQHPSDARAILSSYHDASELLEILLEKGHSTIAGRLAGAFRNIAKDQIANNIIQTMRTAGYDVREHDPFDVSYHLSFSSREKSPYVNRLVIAWESMRKIVMARFQNSSHVIENKEKYLESIDEIYISDAYHSLSIEGYQVTPELIDRVRTGNWDPDKIASDNNQRNALAARGYWQAFQAVKKSIVKVLDGEISGSVVQKDHDKWYLELFGPCITAGILKPRDLSGYRNNPVYIRQSMHVPPNVDAMRELMPAFFKLLSNEQAASARIVLGHFFFVYIHPYMDGNGRMGRFLMNVMLASGGYPWLIIPVEKRSDYLSSLEEASVRDNIQPFCDFIFKLLKDRK